MRLIGDIGNTDIKICLFDNNCKLIKKIRIKTHLLSKSYLSKNISFKIKSVMKDYMSTEGSLAESFIKTETIY